MSKETREQLLREREALYEELAFLKTERQKSAETLQQREREIQALLDMTPQPVIARFDRNLRHTYVHTSVKLATGIPPEAYLGKTSREMGLPDTLIDMWEHSLRQVFASGKEETIEYSVAIPNRRWFYQSRIVPEFDPQGIVQSLIVITRDITERKLADEALLEHVEIVETINSLGQSLSAELDLQKLVQAVTDAATELSGAEFGAFFYNLLDERGESYTLYTLSGVSRETFSKFPMPRNTEVFGPTFRGEGIVRSDDIHKDSRYGKNFPYQGMPEGHLPVTSYLAVPVISRSREVLGGLFFGHSQAGVFTERDERIIEGIAAQVAIALDNARLFQEARDQQERLRITLASIGDAVIATNAAGHISFMNAVAQNLTGWIEADAIGQSLENVFHIVNEYTREVVENPVSKVIREGKVIGLANHTILLARDGREIPIDDSGAPIFDNDQKLIGVILVFRDITERRQNEQQINLLLQLSAAFSQALTANQIAEVVVDQALKALGAHVGTVALLVEQGSMLEILNLRGLSPTIIEQYRRTPLEFPGPLNDAVRFDEIVWMETAAEYTARYPNLAEAIQRNGSQSTIGLPLKVNEKIIGGVNLSFPFEKPRNPSEEAFFVALAQQCAQSLERAHLQEQAKEVATLEERHRLARDLHDAVSQVLFSATTVAESIPRIWEQDPKRASAQLNDVVTLNRAAMAEMRNLLLELRPETIMRTELNQLLEQLLRALKGRKIIQTEFSVQGKSFELPQKVHLTFYRVAQEAVNNIIKHSQATHTQVNLIYQAHTITLRVQDNGKGFNTQQVSNGMGQTTMRERADSSNATLTIQSEPGKGTEIILVWNLGYMGDSVIEIM
jgi:PAS domain S-box-containing protein